MTLSTQAGQEKALVKIYATGDVVYAESKLMDSSKVVTPVKTGVQCFCNMLKYLDSGFHRNDDFWAFSTFDESIKVNL